jgi:8-oxo-dGTP pyrophosphatase MutT (NUDIX family)
VLAQAHRALLKIYQRLPRQARRWVVRLLTPSFTVGAACIIERDDGSVLLVRQVYRRGWGMPGGLAQRREPVADTARREVLEEVGLAVELVGEPRVVVDPDPRRVDVIFRARPAEGCDPSTARPTSPEIAEVRWFLPGDLPDLQHETTAALRVLALLNSV